jgi:hypothetical protein
MRLQKKILKICPYEERWRKRNEYSVEDVSKCDLLSCSCIS